MISKEIHTSMCYYHASTQIRDFIQYVLPNRVFSVEQYKAKQKVLENILKEDNFLRVFCKQNGETGEKIIGNLQQLYDLMYNSTFIRVEGDALHVDKTQNVTVINLVLGIKQTMTEICLLHLNSLKKEGKEVDQKYFDIVNTEEEFFGCVASLAIGLNVFLDRFKEFNQVKRNNKGEDTVESNFIQEEITTLITDASFVRQKTEDTGEHIKKVVESFSKCVDFMTGKTPLQTGEGKTFESNFGPYLQEIQLVINEMEPGYKQANQELVQEMVEFETQSVKEQQAQN